MSELRRVEQVSGRVRAELVSLLLKDVSDPALQSAGITDVEVTKDLRIATVYYREGLGEQWSSQQRKTVAKGFERAKSFLRRKVGDALDAKYTPELRFMYDEHPDEVGRVMRLLNEVSNPL